MKIVINSCYGGFSLSPKAVKRLAELQGRKCYFYESLKYARIQEPVENSLSVWAFDVPEKDIHSHDFWRIHYLTNRPDNRTDPLLIQVVEELGKEANGQYAELRIINIPDGVQWILDEYDGIESVHEKHESWS